MRKNNYSKIKNMDKEKCKNAMSKTKNYQVVDENVTTNEKSPETDCSLTKSYTDKENVENLRSLRLSTILTIAAIMASVCIVLYNISKEILNRDPISGSGYYIFTWFMFITALSSALIIIYDIIIYIWKDLNRYDVKDTKHDKYDDESDNTFHKLKKDFIFLITVLVVLFGVFIIVFIYDLKLKIFVGILALVLFGVIFFEARKKAKLHISWGNIKYCLIQSVVLVVTAGIVFIIVAVSNNIRSSEIEIEYESSGIVTISHESNKAFESLEVNLYSTGQDEPIDHKSVRPEELLYAKEMEFKKETINHNDDVSVSQNISGAKLYWKFVYDISDLGLTDGSYVLEIISEQGMGKAQILNMFTVDNGRYNFGRERIEKTY